MACAFFICSSSRSRGTRARRGRRAQQAVRGFQPLQPLLGFPVLDEPASPRTATRRRQHQRVRPAAAARGAATKSSSSGARLMRRTRASGPSDGSGSPPARLRSRSICRSQSAFRAVVHRAPALRRHAREARTPRLGEQQPRAFARDALARGVVGHHQRRLHRCEARLATLRKARLQPLEQRWHRSRRRAAVRPRRAKCALPSRCARSPWIFANWKRASASSSCAVRIFLRRHDGVAREVVGQHHGHIDPSSWVACFQRLSKARPGASRSLAPLTPQK